MTHEKYNELQKKMDKLASDFVEEMAEREEEGILDTGLEWLDEKKKRTLFLTGRIQMTKKF